MKYLTTSCLVILFTTYFSNLLQAQSEINQTNEILDANRGKMDSLFMEWDSPEKPGLSVGVVKEGKIIYQKQVGMANLEYNIPITDSTKFHVASLAKQFTVFALLQLVEAGKLLMDDDIRKYIPEVPDFGHTITLRHLATHTSGLRDQWNLLILMGVRPDDIVTNEQILALISQQQELNFIPGEEYLYCNTGYSLLAEVVARVSGQTFVEFTKEQIFEPLGMVNTSFYADHEQIIKNRAYSYYVPDRKTYKKRVLSYASVGATNLLTTVDDLSLWANNFKNLKIGSKKIYDEMITPAQLNNENTFGGGMGLFIEDFHGITEIEHSGADAGFRAKLSLFPTYDLSIAVLSNNAQINVQRLTAQLADLFLREHYAESTEIKKNNNSKFIALDTTDAKRFVGHYWNKEHGFTRKIYLSQDTLMHFRTANNESWLAPLSANSFKVMNVPPDVLVEFKFTGSEMYMFETVNGGAPKMLIPFIPVEYSKEDWLEYEGTYFSKELNTIYNIQWNKQDKLIANHLRMGRIELKQVKHNFFLGDRGFFGNIEFLRDEHEKITGLRVTNGRVRNLLFEKHNANEDYID